MAPEARDDLREKAAGDDVILLLLSNMRPSGSRVYWAPESWLL